MIGRVNPAGLLAGRPDVQEQAMMAQQQPTRQGLLGQARSVVGGLLGGVQDQFRNGGRKAMRASIFCASARPPA
jgi:hypothetical protein